MLSRHHCLITDMGYRWVIAFAATVVVFFQLGLMNVLGVIVPELEEQLQISASVVGLCTSIGTGLRSVLGPIGASLAMKVSCRKLVMIGGLIWCLGMITVGLSQSSLQLGFSMALVSIGSAVPNVSKLVILQKYFDKKKFSTAVSLTFAGGSIGLMILPILMEFLVSQLGWRGAISLYGALNLHVCLSGAMMCEPSYKHTSETHNSDSGFDENDEKQNHSNERSLLLQNEKRNNVLPTLMAKFADLFGLVILTQNPLLTVYLIAMTIHEAVLSGWTLFLVSHTVASMYSSDAAAILVGIAGGGTLLGRLLVGPLTDKVSGLTMFFVYAVGGVISLCLYTLTVKYWSLAVVSFLSGFCLATTAPIYVVILKDMFPDDTKHFADSIGLQYMFRGIGTLIGGPLTGMVYDMSRSFSFSFAVLAVLESVAAILTRIEYLCPIK